MNSSQHPSSLARKIALTWLVATAPLLASTVFYIVTYANRDSAFVERELAGTRVLRPLDALMENLPAHQRLAHPPAGAGPTDPARLAASQAQIGSRFAAAGRMYAEFARTAPRRAAGVRPGPDLATLAAEWRELGDLPEPAAAASRARYDHLLGNLRETIRQIGNSSNLILDPELDSYFLADLVVDVLPRAQNRLATLEQLGRRILRPAEPARLDRAELAITAAQLRESDVALIDLDVRTALEEDMNFHGMSPSLQQRVPPAARNYAETHARLLHLLDGLAADTPPDVTEEALLSAVDQARAAGFGLWRAAVAELDQLLELRLNIYRRYRLWAYAFIGLAFVSSTGMTVAMARSVTARIHTEQEAERETRRHNAELERRVAERTTQLTATVAELEAFSYSVSHDLRNPLRAIDGFSRALEEDYVAILDETARDYLVRIRRGSQRMGLLIDDMLKLSRVNRVEMAKKELNLTEMAQEIVAHLRRQEPQRPVTFVCAEGLTARGDASLLQAALVNLLENAWKYTRRQRGARIEFFQQSAPDESGAKVFVVRDNGAGFDMKYAGKLFTAFQRLHNASEFEGTGVGLATVQRILARHGGRIRAEAAPGLGASFYFSIGPP